MTEPRFPPAASRRRSLLAVAAVLLASGAVGFLSYRLVRPVPGPVLTATPARMPAASRDEEPPEPAAPQAPQVPETLPELQLPGADGKAHRLTEWKGRPLVINFWATWCDPCRREIPLLKELRREHAADRLEIVGIAIDYPESVRKYAEGHGIDYPLLLGEREGLRAAEAFGMETVLPFSVFADREGRVITLKIGELHRDEAELILDRIRDLQAGRLTLSAAQAQISAGVRSLREARAGRD